MTVPDEDYAKRSCQMKRCQEAAMASVKTPSGKEYSMCRFHAEATELLKLLTPFLILFCAILVLWAFLFGLGVIFA